MKLFPRFVLMPCFVLFLAAQAGFSEPFMPDTDPRDNPCQVVVKYFQTLQSGDLAAARSHTMNGQYELTQNEVDQFRRILGDQRLRIQLACSTSTRQRAIVVSGPLVLTPPDESGIKPQTLRFVFELDGTLGQWLVRDIRYQTDEESAATVAAFRKDFSDSLEVPIPESATSVPGPREIVDAFFKAVMRGDLKNVAAVLDGNEEPLSQGNLDQIRTALGDQKLAIATALMSRERNQALVVSEPFRITLSGEDPPPIGRYILVLSNKTGPWRIHDLDFESLENAAEAEVDFRKQYADAEEIPAPETTRAVPEKSKRKLRVFGIEHADATAVSAILNELFGDLSIVVDGRTSSLFVRFENDEEIEELAQVVTLLDQPKKDDRKPAASDGPMSGQPGKINTNDLPADGTLQVDLQAIYKWLESEVDAEYVAEVRAGAMQAEAEALAKAEWIRSQLKVDRDPERRAEYRRQLRNLVEASYMGRLSLQKSELALLRNRLAGIESQIQSREKLRARIIDRRVDELLDPALQWPAVGARFPAADPTAPKNGNPLATLSGPAGLQQTVSPQALAQRGGGSPIGLGGPVAKVQVRFRNPSGTKIIWSAHESLNPLVVPARIDLVPGSQHGFMLAGIKGREGQQIAGSIQVLVSEKTSAYVSHNSVPVEFTEEDFDQVTSGNLVTKAIYLPDPEFQKLAIAGVETLVSTRTDPGVDAVAEADKRGAILAILRLGDRVQAATTIKLAPADDDAELSLEAKIRGGSGILFFESESCQVCEKVRPEFTKEMSKVGLPFLSIDVLKHPQIAKRFRVSSTPTFVWITSEVELERATGAEFQTIVSKFAKYWEESGGARAGIGFGNGLRSYLRQELVTALGERESLLTDITSLELSMADLSEAIQIPAGGSIEVRKSKEDDEMMRKSRLKRTQEVVETLRAELRPVDARLVLIRQRLAELDSGTTASSDPQSAVVWIEAIIEHASVNGTRDVSATYMNGTVISPQGHIAVCAGPGSTEEDVRKAVLKLTVKLSDGTSHQGRLLAYDTQSGAAVIKIEAAGLNCLEICDDPIAKGRRLDVFALVQGSTPSPVKAPVYVVDSRFKVGDHDGFFAVAEASQTSLKSEFMGAPIVTTSGQLQGVLAENEAVLYGPGVQPEDPKPRRAAAIPANVIRRLLNRTAEPQPDTAAPEKPADPVE